MFPPGGPSDTAAEKAHWGPARRVREQGLAAEVGSRDGPGPEGVELLLAVDEGAEARSSL